MLADKVNNLVYKLDLHKRFINKHLSEFSLFLAEKSSDSPKVIIDVGAGRSPYKHIFTGVLAGDYISVDIDVKRYPNLNVIGIGQNLPFGSHVADVVLLIEVLEHVFDYKDLLKEINRILKPNGCLVLTVPFILGYHDRIDCYRYTEEALRELLKEHGFKIRAVRKRGGIFACLSGIMFQIPNSIATNKFLSLIFLFLLTPLIFVILMLDRLDKKANFTLGYDVLANKTAGDYKNKGN